LLLHAVKLTN